jgi:hypothetical protein
MSDTATNPAQTREAFTALSATTEQLAEAGLDRASVLAAAVQLVRVLMVETEDRSIIAQVVEALIQ